jgi:hypothetical protein
LFDPTLEVVDWELVVEVASVVDWPFPPSELELVDSVQREVVLDSVQREVVLVGPDSVVRAPGLFVELVVVLVVTVRGVVLVVVVGGVWTEVVVLAVTAREVESVDDVESEVCSVLTSVSFCVVDVAAVVEVGWTD